MSAPRDLRRPLALLASALVVPALLLGGCTAAPTVTVDAPQPAVARAARTIAAAEIDPLQLEGPMEARTRREIGAWIAAAVRQELDARGIAVAPAGTSPDLVGRALVASRDNVQQVTGWSAVGRGMTREQIRWREGMLVIEIGDAATGDLVWRGTATAVIKGANARGQAAIDEVIARMFRSWPDG